MLSEEYKEDLNKLYGKLKEQGFKVDVDGRGEINPIVKRNRKAMIDGKTGEEEAVGFIQALQPDKILEQLNSTIDFLLNGLYVEVKTCQYWVSSFRRKTRKGLFCM
ncbi:unnamed protein product, partial [marine sediment metagenome]